jgi:hypothetical protein
MSWHLTFFFLFFTKTKEVNNYSKSCANQKYVWSLKKTAIIFLGYCSEKAGINQNSGNPAQIIVNSAAAYAMSEIPALNSGCGLFRISNTIS